tara:strand:- start:149 stop:940 length:792 start_codon:yes stop_codon:yes gene_type:complete
MKNKHKTFRFLSSLNDIKKFLSNFSTREEKKEIINLKQRLKSKTVYPYNTNDAYKLYNLIIKSKRLCALEFGSGWSTLIIAKALFDLKKTYLKDANKLRKQDKFCLYVVETSHKWKKITEKRIPKEIKKEIKIKFLVTQSQMSLFNNKICTLYKKLPNCNPDFIYLDGPHIGDTKRNVSGINFSKNIDFTPMSGDLLLIENILIPGTIIHIDGRKNNFYFLKNNFQRNWKIFDYTKKDYFSLKLNDKPLGIYNKRVLKYFNDD